MKGLLQFKAVLSCVSRTVALIVAGVWLSMSGTYVWAADLANDPTRPLMNITGIMENEVQPLEEDTEKPLVLQSVVTNGLLKRAVINNQLLYIGQQIEGYELTRITSYGAELMRDGEGLSLKLFNVNIRKNTNEE